MFGIQGLWSAARYQVPVAFVVMNNGEYRTLRETLDAMKSRSTALGSYVGLDITPPALDWTIAARFFGIEAVRVRTAQELGVTAASFENLDAPLPVDVPIAGHEPKNGGAPTGPLAGDAPACRGSPSRGAT